MNNIVNVKLPNGSLVAVHLFLDSHGSAMLTAAHYEAAFPDMYAVFRSVDNKSIAIRVRDENVPLGWSYSLKFPIIEMAQKRIETDVTYIGYIGRGSPYKPSTRMYLDVSPIDLTPLTDRQGTPIYWT